jgi:hypothetical protein
MFEWHHEWITTSEAQFLLRDRAFAKKQIDLTREAHDAGAFQSSGMGVGLYQLLDEEVVERSNLLLAEYKASLDAATDIGPQQVDGAGQCAEQTLRTTYKHLVEQTDISAYLARFGLYKVKEDSELNLASAIARLSIEIKRAGTSAMKKREQQASGQTNVTIEGHGNVVQVGTTKSTVGLNFNPTTVSSLSRAFDNLRSAVAASDAPLEIKAELVEVIDDCKSEVLKTTPNRSKFTGLLGGLATTIQTAGSLKGAYEVFKITAASAGITLP